MGRVETGAGIWGVMRPAYRCYFFFLLFFTVFSLSLCSPGAPVRPSETRDVLRSAHSGGGARGGALMFSASVARSHSSLSTIFTRT